VLDARLTGQPLGEMVVSSLAEVAGGPSEVFRDERYP
jgi:hypothetical protein